MKRPALIDLGLLLALSLILRAALLGHPNLFIDEAFYTSVGAAMHQGALPYVDVWDRKPFGLFALYWLFTTFSPFPLGYQLAAIVFSGATGWVVSRIALLWTPRRAALSAGALYVLSLGLFQGFGGQSPVFYNLPMALAVLLVLRSRQTLRACGPDGATYLAMVLAGLAITIKTTALFEAGFLGLYAAFCSITQIRRQQASCAKYSTWPSPEQRQPCSLPGDTRWPDTSPNGGRPWLAQTW